MDQKRALLGDNSATVLKLSRKCQKINKDLKDFDRQKSRATKNKQAYSTSSRSTAASSPVPVENRRQIIPLRREITPENARMMQEGRCFCCQKTGHRAFECPEKGKLPAIGAMEELSDSGKD